MWRGKRGFLRRARGGHAAEHKGGNIIAALVAEETDSLGDCDARALCGSFGFLKVALGAKHLDPISCLKRLATASDVAGDCAFD